MHDAWIVIGSVQSVQVTRREIRVRVAPRYKHQLDGIDRIRLRTGEATPITCRVLEVRPGKRDIIVRLNPGVTRDAVADLKGAEIVIAPDECKARPGGAYDIEELLGMNVVGQDGASIGTVTGVYETGANDVIEVKRNNGKTVMLPVIPQLMTAIDLDAQRIEVADITPYAVDQ